jgi:hypothetical protein
VARARPSRLWAVCAIFWAILGLLVAGCVAAAPAETPEPRFTPEPVFTPRTVAATPPTSGTPSGPLTERDVAELLRAAVCWYDDLSRGPDCTPPGPDVVEALERMAASGDERFLAPLVDMLAIDVGWQRYVREALERLSGTSRSETAGWYHWLWERDPALPEGYAEWKGRLFSVVDPRFAELLDGELGALPAQEVLWGEVRVDGLPPLAGPETVHRVEERYLADSDVVYGVFINEEALAFPERIVGWHEVVRTAVGGQPVLFVACVPCGGAAAYRATASDGGAYTLGTSGLVYRSRRLLYDEETGSLWDPVSGRAVGGPLAAAGVRLLPLPVRRTTWGEWNDRNPNTEVLSLETGFVRNYDEGAAQAEERSWDAPLYPVLASAGRLHAKTLVVGLVLGGEARAYPLDALERARIVHDQVGGLEVVLVSLGPGTGVSIYDESGVEFVDVQGRPDSLEAIDTDEIRWFMGESRLVNTMNSRVREALAARVAYWFAWADAYPDTSVWGQ